MTRTAFDVLNGSKGWSVEESDALAFLKRLPDRSCSLVFFSPPYEAARTYGVGFKLKGQAWVDWLAPIVVESARVSSGLVVVNAAGQVRDWKYSPAVECLVADLTRVHGLVCGPSPYAWTKNGTPGSGSTKYHRRDWEPLYTFALKDRLPLAWANPLEFGEKPKYPPGGEFSNRNPEGVRKNAKRSMPTQNRTGDKPASRQGTMPAVANPGNVVRVVVGGGNLGSNAAHKSEAPMPLGLAERFVCWYARPGSVVCDPFTGSGTTGHAAVLHGRKFVGCDLRPCQVAVASKRISEVTPDMFENMSGVTEPSPGADRPHHGGPAHAA